MSPCIRCNGLVIQQYIVFTRYDELRRFPQYMFRCLNCGDYFDALVLLNRRVFTELIDERNGNSCQNQNGRQDARVIVQQVRKRSKPKRAVRRVSISRYK